MDFTNKTIVITGGAGGIGKSVANSVYSKGANVVLVDMNKEALKEAKNDLDLENERTLLVAADTSSEEDTKNYIQQAEDKFGSIDGLANIAGISGKNTHIDDVTADDFDKIYNVNLKGTFLGTKYAVKAMKKSNKEGAIVNLSSVAGLIGYEGMHPYVATKHAVIGLTKSTALEVAKHKIRVNAVSPAQVDTQLQRRLDEDTGDAEEARKELSKVIPLARYAETEEIANSVRFLLSSESNYMTGSTLTIDGGLTAH